MSEGRKQPKNVCMMLNIFICSVSPTILCKWYLADYTKYLYIVSEVSCLRSLPPSPPSPLLSVWDLIPTPPLTYACTLTLTHLLFPIHPIPVLERDCKPSSEAVSS